MQQAQNKKRDTVVKTEILNSSEKKMKNGEKPGSIQSTAEVRRTARKRPAEKPTESKPGKKPLNTKSKNK